MDHRITFKESLFLLPVLILLGIFSVYTICQTAIYSFFDYQLSDPVKNGMYLSSQFNAGLFEEGLKYIRFYIGDDAALAPDDASAEGFAELDRLCGEGFALLAELDVPEDEAKCKLSNAHLAALRTLQAEIASARAAAYHGFRYAQIDIEGEAEITSLSAYFINSSVARTGRFECSDKLINQIHRNVIWGQLSNLMSIPTDCPQKDERFGWLGAAHLLAEETIYNFDMYQFLRKYLDDMRASQNANGSLWGSCARLLEARSCRPALWRRLRADPVVPLSLLRRPPRAWGKLWHDDPLARLARAVRGQGPDDARALCRLVPAAERLLDGQHAGLLRLHVVLLLCPVRHGKNRGRARRTERGQDLLCPRRAREDGLYPCLRPGGRRRRRPL